MSQFKALSRREVWSNDVFKQEKQALQTALVLQFNDIYGDDETDANSWKELCKTMDIRPMPRNMKECKQVVIT